MKAITTKFWGMHAKKRSEVVGVQNLVLIAVPPNLVNIKYCLLLAGEGSLYAVWESDYSRP